MPVLLNGVTAKQQYFGHYCVKGTISDRPFQTSLFFSKAPDFYFFFLPIQ